MRIALKSMSMAGGESASQSSPQAGASSGASPSSSRVELNMDWAAAGDELDRGACWQTPPAGTASGGLGEARVAAKAPGRTLLPSQLQGRRPRSPNAIVATATFTEWQAEKRAWRGVSALAGITAGRSPGDRAAAAQRLSAAAAAVSGGKGGSHGRGGDDPLPPPPADNAFEPTCSHVIDEGDSPGQDHPALPSSGRSSGGGRGGEVFGGLAAMDFYAGVRSMTHPQYKRVYLMDSQDAGLTTLHHRHRGSAANTGGGVRAPPSAPRSVGLAAIGHY